ncbi:MAG: AAA family ATPase [Bacillota bacterium]
MNKITARLFGTPEVLYNGHQMTFPFRKAEALFYYLLVKRHATRDELVNLLWGEVDENVAKKNLRNAVYMIRKVFDGDVIVSPQRAILQLSSSYQWDIDVETFLEGKEKSDHNPYKGEFLQGFLVKDADIFEQWMFQTRERFRDQYIGILHKEIKECLAKKDYTQAENCCKQLIQCDELDERAYRTLMRIYSKEEQFNKGIEAYHRLVEVLERELSISPDVKTIEVFETLLKDKSVKESIVKQSTEQFYFGREKEIHMLKQNLFQFLTMDTGKSVVIFGEAGIGKSRLLDRFLQNQELEDTHVLGAYCYQAEEKYLLKPWNGIFSKLSHLITKENIEIPLIWQNIISYIFPVFAQYSSITDENPVEKVDILKYQVAEKAIVNVLQKVAQDKKLILFFEDLQWIDEMSLSLLKNVILEDRNQSIMVVATCRSGFEEKVDPVIIECIRYDLMERMELQRFSKGEIEAFAVERMPNYHFTDQIKEMMVKETEGNPFFLIEFLNNLHETGYVGGMSSKMKDILKSRFLSVSKEGQKILNIASIFFDKVSFGNLQTLSGKNELELMDILEELQSKYLLKELGDEKEIKYAFTHQKLREYVYEQLSLSRRRILHHRIAELLEGYLKNNKSDIYLYSKLIHHYLHGGNKLKALKYTIKNLETYLHFSHEIFPVLSDLRVVEERYLYLNEVQALQQLNDLEILLKEVKGEEGNSEEFEELEFSFFHMLGRFYIRQGEYDRGIRIIEDMIERALILENYDAALKGYRQMTYYCINTQNTGDMEKYVNKALEIAEKSGQQGETGILLRLKGLQRVLEGKYDEGERLLENAITIFRALNQNNEYVLNIAAAYNFIGESKRHKCQFVEAISFYDKAISICEENKLVRGLTVFYTNAGQAAFDMGDDQKANDYLNKALYMYEQLDSLWGRSTAKGYTALLLVKEGRYKEALTYLQMAEEDANKLKSPYEIGLVWRVKAEVRAMMKTNDRLESYFEGYLSKNVEEYCEEAMKVLKHLKGCYESERMSCLKYQS